MGHEGLGACPRGTRGFKHRLADAHDARLAVLPSGALSVLGITS